MGDWVVLSAWNKGDGFHDWHSRGFGSLGEEQYGGPPEDPWGAAMIVSFSCCPVVQGHQSLEESPRVPEFTISVSFHNPPLPNTAAPSSRRGWKWKLSWTDRQGKPQMRSGYGFASVRDAKSAAEGKAMRIALSELPEEIYKFTPEV